MEARNTPRPQLVKNPGFEQGLSYWSYSGGSAVVTSSRAYEESYSATFESLSGTSGVIYQVLVSYYDQFDFSAKVFVDSEPSGASGGIGLYNRELSTMPYGVSIFVENGEPYVSVLVLSYAYKFKAPSDCVGRWLTLELVMVRVSDTTYRLAVYVDGISYLVVEGENMSPVNQVVLFWAGDYYRPYFDLVQFYDLSSGTFGAWKPELLTWWSLPSPDQG